MILRLIKWCVGLFLALIVALLIMLGLGIALIYPKLPDVSALVNYQPKLPLRIFTSDGVLIAEFGEEMRRLTPISQIPDVMKHAVLAIEDANFYSHSGVDLKGLTRAAIANLSDAGSQGASTITMQVARNVYLSSEKTISRKIYEILLTFKLERLLSKNQILEIYMNQIYLGQRAYGFARASEVYFGQPLSQISVAQAAMLAGLPKAPSKYNPIVNPERAHVRQQYIIDRMASLKFITPEQAQQAKSEVLQYKTSVNIIPPYAQYAAETARQLLYKQYGSDTYTLGLNVYTTIHSEEQKVAYDALRTGIMRYEQRHAYRGPEKFIELPADTPKAENIIENAFSEHLDAGELQAAIVLKVQNNRIESLLRDGQIITINPSGVRFAAYNLSSKAPENVRIKRGAIIRVIKNNAGEYRITQLPEVEGAFVALDPKTGAITAMVGGFDFNKNKFNHVTQAWRQPGSSFKPFIYSAGLEIGITPSTVINDAPIYIDAATTGGQPWEPKNYDGKFSGPMTVRSALGRSKNMVSIRILQKIGAQEAQSWVTRFGFEADKHPPYLTMALGAGSVTPMQMVSAYGVFANGGYRINPILIERILDSQGNKIQQATVYTLSENMRTIPARNAFLTTSLMQTVTTRGTAAAASQALGRSDIYGKTGTTNDSIDAWFAGFHPSRVAVVWIGYDTPRNLGSRETGGGLSLPVWIQYMKYALKNQAIQPLVPPEGVVQSNGEWYYTEFVHGAGGVNSIDVHSGSSDNHQEDNDNSVPEPASTEEKQNILDLFSQ